MKKILVTGGTTFVSKYVAEWYLEHNTEVNKKPYFEFIDENLSES